MKTLLVIALLVAAAHASVMDGGIGIESSEQDAEYVEENDWLSNSDFEGLFEEEGVKVDEHMVDSDYRDEGDVRRPPEVILETDTAGETLSESSPGPELPNDGHFHDGDLALGSRWPPTDGATDEEKGSKLPSFEETPMPVKPTLSQWRKEKRRKQMRNESPPFELTSSLYLVPGVRGYVGACTVVRDDHDYIIEWVNHHLSLGIRPLYVYDHRSLPPLGRFLQPYIADGRVVLERYEADKEFQGTSPQLYAYDDCLRRHGSNHQWLAFLDVDEFLMFRNSDPIQSLGAFLKDYEGFSALAVHWILFGSSDYESKPLRSVLRSYTRCMPLKHTQHLFVKSIVNTRCTVHTSDSPHSFVHNCSAPAVRTDGSPIEGATASDAPVHDTLVIHHYATKSLEDFELKVLKGSGMRRGRGWDYFYFVDGWSTEFNFDGLKIWNDDVVSRTRSLDPFTIQQQLAGYAQETLEDFWGNSQVTENEVRETVDGDLSWGDGDADVDAGDYMPIVSYDADEGEW